MKFTVHDQLELLRGFFYPLVLFLYVRSGLKHTIYLEGKRSDWNQYISRRILQQVNSNRSILAVLSERRNAEPAAVHADPEAAQREKDAMVKQLMEAQRGTKKSKWGWVLKVGLFAFVIYMLKEKQNNQQGPMRPPPSRGYSQ